MTQSAALTVNSSGLNYGYSSQSLNLEKSVLNILSKVAEEPVTQPPIEMSTAETSNHLLEDFKDFFPSGHFSKEYKKVFETNLRRYFDPTALPEAENDLLKLTPAIVQPKKPLDSSDRWAAPIQSFEGRVISASAEAMDVILIDKTGGMVDHEARIEIAWVSDQDRDLVKPGAVFYLSLFKERSQSGSIRNSEEIRFRRLPNWSQSSIDKIRAKADSLLKNRFKTAPVHLT